MASISRHVVDGQHVNGTRQAEDTRRLGVGEGLIACRSRREDNDARRDLTRADAIERVALGDETSEILCGRRLDSHAHARLVDISGSCDRFRQPLEVVVLEHVPDRTLSGNDLLRVVCRGPLLLLRRRDGRVQRDRSNGGETQTRPRFNSPQTQTLTTNIRDGRPMAAV